MAQLEAPELFPLKRRLVVRVALDGLRRDELDAFLAHRFGDAARRVPPSLKDELFERTRGAPALVDRVVAYALARPTKMSPPASVGTRSTGINGIQGPTRWRADGSSP
jgi:type II secretory pathway predicted ATPase ExeA